MAKEHKQRDKYSPAKHFTEVLYLIWPDNQAKWNEQYGVCARQCNYEITLLYLKIYRYQQEFTGDVLAEPVKGY